MTPFATTSWTLISRTRDAGENARQATAELCRQYWHALYAYARRSGLPNDQAEDAVQAFLAHAVEHDVFTHADAERGRFRTFLLTAFRQYMARIHRDQSRQKRAPEGGLLRLDFADAEQMLGSAPEGSPETAFDRAWAVTQLDTTWRVLEREFEQAGKAALFTALRPIVAGDDDSSMREIADRLRMTEGALNVAAYRLRRRYGEVLRETIGHTLASLDEVDDEIARLRSALGPTQS